MATRDESMAHGYSFRHCTATADYPRYYSVFRWLERLRETKGNARRQKMEARNQEEIEKIGER